MFVFGGFYETTSHKFEIVTVWSKAVLKLQFMINYKRYISGQLSLFTYSEELNSFYSFK